jgi:hypothetical protein
VVLLAGMNRLQRRWNLGRGPSLSPSYIAPTDRITPVSDPGAAASSIATLTGDSTPANAPNRYRPPILCLVNRRWIVELPAITRGGQKHFAAEAEDSVDFP